MNDTPRPQFSQYLVTLRNQSGLVIAFQVHSRSIEGAIETALRGTGVLPKFYYAWNANASPAA